MDHIDDRITGDGCLRAIGFAVQQSLKGIAHLLAL
jgi:hypothetical protein